MYVGDASGGRIAIYGDYEPSQTLNADGGELGAVGSIFTSTSNG